MQPTDIPVVAPETGTATTTTTTTAVAPPVPAVTLSAPAGYRLPDLADLATGLTVSPLEERAITTILWDTADLRLARWGCSLSHREGEGWTVELPPDGDDGPAHRVHRCAGGGDAVPDAALDLVAAFARTGVLQPRLELLVSAGATTQDAAAGLVRALGDAGPPEVEPERVRRRSSAAAVVRRAIARATVRLILHDPGVRLGGDPEAVHQARVAVRRLRSDLRTFGPMLAPEWSDPLREELRWIGAELGRVRDAEVLAGEIAEVVGRLPEADQGAGRRLAADFHTEIARDRERLLEAMRSPRYLALLERLVEASHSPMLLPAADEAAREVLPRLVARPWSRLRKGARRLGRDAADDDLHALRIRAKRARYAAEAGAPVLGRRARAFARAVARLQDVLGAHQDAVVAAERLRSRSGSRAIAFAAGQAWGLEREAAQTSRDAWPKAWKAARRRRLRSWM